MGWDDDKTGDYVPPEVPMRAWLVFAMIFVTITLIIAGSSIATAS